METACIAEDLRDVLVQQIALIERLSEEEMQLQELVIQKNWVGLEESISKLKDFSERVMQLETQRHQIYTDLKKEKGLSEEDGFYDLLASMPESDRRELSELYRKLKVNVLKVQTLNGGLDSYIRSATYTMEKILDEFVPEQKGKIYSKNGYARKGEGKPLFFSKRY